MSTLSILEYITKDIPDMGNKVSQEVLEIEKLIESVVDTFNVVISIMVGVLSFFIVSYQELNSSINSSIEEFKEEFGGQLVSTNAVMINPETRKIAITAKLMLFYERKFYDEIESHSETEINEAESIDVLRSFSFQDLILSPRYLDYFFKRSAIIGNPVRLVVIDNDNVCMATISYLMLCVKAGYTTYIIPNIVFKTICGKIKRSENNILKGNPYLVKIKGSVMYGKYTNREGKATEVSDKKALWEILETIKSYAVTVSESDVFSVTDVEAILNRLKKETIKI